MSIFYTVSRRGIINDRFLNYINMSDVYKQINITNDTILNFLDDSFPNGISRHGMTYLCESLIDKYYQINIAIETVFELIRKIHFPEMASRFESLFAWETLEEAKRFKSSSDNYYIYKVESKKNFKADMNLLTIGVNYFELVNNAKRYWSGKPSVNPRWEYLLQYPIEVLDKVE